MQPIIIKDIHIENSYFEESIVLINNLSLSYEDYEAKGELFGSNFPVRRAR